MSFETNEDYITQELSKYKFQKIEGPFDNDGDYEYLFSSLDPNDLRKEGYKVYYIKIHHEPHNNFANGIATKNKMIMYFYSFPD